MDNAVTKFKLFKKLTKDVQRLSLNINFVCASADSLIVTADRFARDYKIIDELDDHLLVKCNNYDDIQHKIFCRINNNMYEQVEDILIF